MTLQDNDAAAASSRSEKLSLSTLKRQPKMELSKSDLLKLLSVMEGELEARDIVIAVLKCEHIKRAVYATANSGDAAAAIESLHRDALNAIPKTSPAELVQTASRLLHNVQNQHLELVINRHRALEAKYREELETANDTIQKLETKIGALERGDGLLIDRIREEAERKMCYEQRASELLEKERSRHKHIVLTLLAERKKLIVRLLQERQRSQQLVKALGDEKSRTADMVDGLEEESKRSLQMEEETERLSKQVQLLLTENQQLKRDIERLSSSGVPLLGEGVRSAIVATPPVHSIPTVTPTPQPARSIATAPPVWRPPQDRPRPPPVPPNKPVLRRPPPSNVDPK